MYTGALSGPVVPTRAGQRKESALWAGLAFWEEAHFDDEGEPGKVKTLWRRVEVEGSPGIWVKMKASPTGMEGLG